MQTSIENIKKTTCRQYRSQTQGRTYRSKSKPERCTALDLSVYKIIGQPVRYSHRWLSKACEVANQTNVINAAKPIREAMPLINAFNHAGFIDNSRLEALKNALSSYDFTVLSNWLSSVLTDAINATHSKLMEDIQATLSTLPYADKILPKLAAYDLYYLFFTSEFIDGREIVFGYRCSDFFQHHYIKLNSVPTEMQSFYCSLLNKLLLAGDGIWQPYAVEQNLHAIRSIDTESELCAIKNWLDEAAKLDPEQLDAELKSSYESHENETVLCFIQDVVEMFYFDIDEVKITDVMDKDSFFSSAEESVAFLESKILMTKLTERYNSFNEIAQAGLPDSGLGLVLTKVAETAARQQLTSYDSFSLADETWGGSGLVLTMFDENSALQKSLDELSQSVYTDFLNCSETEEVWEIDVQSSRWFEELRQRMLMTSLLMYCIEACELDLMQE